MPRKLFEKEKNPKVNLKRKRSDSDSYKTERLTRFGFLGFKVSVQKGNWNKNHMKSEK